MYSCGFNNNAANKFNNELFTDPDGFQLVRSKKQRKKLDQNNFEVDNKQLPPILSEEKLHAKIKMCIKKNKIIPTGHSNQRIVERKIKLVDIHKEAFKKLNLNLYKTRFDSEYQNWKYATETTIDNQKYRVIFAFIANDYLKIITTITVKNKKNHCGAKSS